MPYFDEGDEVQAAKLGERSKFDIPPILLYTDPLLMTKCKIRDEGEADQINNQIGLINLNEFFRYGY